MVLCPMLKVFRNVAYGEVSASPTLFERVLGRGLRLFTLAVTFICLMDAINVDVIYAALGGDMRYQDNPAIVDSQFDSGVLQLDASQSFFQHFDQSISRHQRDRTVLQAPIKFLGTVIYEDVDSPTVLDGATTSTLIYYLLPTTPFQKVRSEGALAAFDRPISFLQLLI